MKKRRLLSVFAAFAVAAASIVVPADTGFGGNIQVSAAPVAQVEKGGLTLTKVGAADNDILVSDDTYVNSLKPGDLVQLNILVPELSCDLINMDLKVSYDQSIFYVYQWYKRGNTDVEIKADDGRTVIANTSNWPYPGPDFSGTDGDVNYDNGYLTLSCAGHPDESSASEDRQITAFNTVDSTTTDGATKYLPFTAIFKVKDTVSQISNFNFEIIMKEPGVIPADGKDGTSLDWADDGDEDDDTQWVSVWQPQETTATTIGRTVGGSVAKTITGRVTGYDFTDDANQIDLAAKPMQIQIYGTPSGTSVDPWYGPVPETILDTVTVDPTDGTFEIRGLEPSKQYTLKINAWCLEDEKTITTDSNMDQDLSDWNIWMYGDVNHSGTIDAGDATSVLKFIVGKTSAITYSNGAGNDQYKSGNVFNSDAINARDATQILRKSVNLPSVYDDNHLKAF